MAAVSRERARRDVAAEQRSRDRLAAIATERIRLVPMVICRLNYTLGVLAKETSILSIVSGGRFELGIGAGDYPAEYAALAWEFQPWKRRHIPQADNHDALVLEAGRLLAAYVDAACGN